MNAVAERQQRWSTPARRKRTRTRDRLDGFDWAVLILFAVVSGLLLALLVSKSHADHTWVGGAGQVLGDQLQYLGWIRNAGHNGLISNPFELGSSPRNYLHPGLAVSGLLSRVGVKATYVYLLWTPVAIVGFFLATRAYANRVLKGLAQRRVALVIALFYFAPVAAFAARSQWRNESDLQTIASEIWPGRYLWGYPFTALAVAAFAAALLTYERDRTTRRVRAWAPALGLLCSWLQPWQGATLLVVLLGGEALQFRRTRANIRSLLLTVVATIGPLAYYLFLSRHDAAWKLARDVNQADLLPWSALLLCIAPLALPALLAYRRRGDTFQESAVRVWPFAAVGVYAFIAITHVGTLAPHALQGLSIPLAVLAVAGVGSLNVRMPQRAVVWVAAIALLALLTPGLLQRFDQARDVAANDSEPYYLRDGELRALEYLDANGLVGGVLASSFISPVVPGLTGRDTWLGLPSWTPNYQVRRGVANTFFAGGIKPTNAVLFAASTHARFVLSDCRNRVDLTSVLRPYLRDVKHFECATVYELGRPTPSTPKPAGG